MDKGILTVSIDLEVAWRCCGDRRLSPSLRDGMRLEAEVVPRVLALFAKYDVSATWAVVGHLLLDRCTRAADGTFHPEIPRPIVPGEQHDWFFQHPDGGDADAHIFYGREIVERIRAARPRQEIGSHSFAHVPYTEHASNRAAVEADLREAKRLHESLGLPFDTFIFPRNGIGHRDLLAQEGIRCYRGNPRLWYDRVPSSVIRNLCSYASYFFAVTPPTVRPRRDEFGLVDIPRSSLLMSRNGVRRWLPKEALARRIVRGLHRAVERGETFHFWFHPCNFTDRLDQLEHQFALLERLLAEASALRAGGHLEILTMREQTERVLASQMEADSVAYHDRHAAAFRRRYEQFDEHRLSTAFACGRAHLADRIDALLRTLKPGSRILDLGCGTGDQVKQCRERGFEVVGVEPSPSMRAIAAANNPGVAILPGVAQSIPLDDASVDLVLAIEVIRYLDDATARKAYREMLRVLKPGGVAFVTLVNRWALDGFAIFHTGKRLLASLGLIEKPLHCEFVTPAGVKAQLHSLGAGSARTEGCLFAPLRIAYKIHPRLGRTLGKLLYLADSRLADGLLTRFAGHLVCVFSAGAGAARASRGALAAAGGGMATMPSVVTARRSLPSTPAIRCMHVITDVETAGAELMLYRLLSRMDHDRFSQVVVSLDRYGPVGHRIAALGIDVHALDMRNPLRWPVGSLRLRTLMRELKPDIVQTWLYHADLLGLMAARMADVPHVVWNVRSGTNRHERRSVHHLAWMNGRLAPLVDRIVINSERGRDAHVGLGYPKDKLTVVPNGYDLAEFAPAPQRRGPLRSRWNIPADALVVGMLANWRPVKGYDTFVRAAAIAARQERLLWFALAGGRGVEPSNEALMSALRQAGVAARTTLMGFLSDPTELYHVCDLYTSASYSEGFPNVIAEAMACGLPCAVTDAGESAAIVGDTGQVVPPGRPELLADAWLQQVRLDEVARRRMGNAARARIQARYDIDAVARRMEELYFSLVPDRRPAEGL